jgi:iron(II)-dependent oxidoreductase
MTSPQILGQLSGLQAMMRELVTSVPSAEANARFDPELPCLAWYLGRSVYRETYWLREVLAGDPDLTRRVRKLFTPADLALEEQCTRLPPPDHLINWAQEIQDEHLRRLATPGELPAHPLLRNDRLQWFLLQETARDYEAMLSVLLARRLSTPTPYRVAEPLMARMPAPELAEVNQGHYRVGSRDEPFAYDNELPPQAVELSGFRIAKRPVTNAEYLAFMEAGGYERQDLWTDEGRGWPAQSKVAAPWQWRRDPEGNWYEMALNGPVDLAAEEPVSGINRHEAAAVAAWASGLGGDLIGAVLQHEYQWEVAARTGVIEGTGRIWEWCANPFHPYPELSPFPDGTVSEPFFGGGHFSLRGASLHTQRCLRRASFRNWALPQARCRFAGIRLVFPPS